MVVSRDKRPCGFPLTQPKLVVGRQSLEPDSGYVVGLLRGIQELGPGRGKLSDVIVLRVSFLGGLKGKPQKMSTYPVWGSALTHRHTQKHTTHTHTHPAGTL